MALGALMYLGWHDPDKKRTPADKLAAAVERYRRKWGKEPKEALVNIADFPHLANVPPPLVIRAMPNVAPNTYMVGSADE